MTMWRLSGAECSRLPYSYRHPRNSLCKHIVRGEENDVSFRIGQFVFTPNSILLPLALAFFIALGYQYLRQHRLSALTATVVIAAAVCGGAIGAWLYGRLGSIDSQLHTWLDIRLGSYGGYWGTLLAAMAVAGCVKRSPIKVADAFVVPLLTAGAVARIGCTFSGCCRGLIIHAPFQPFRLWPLYDLAALLATSALIHLIPRRQPFFQKPGGMIVLFCLLYAPLRFALEFLRDTPEATALSIGHVASLVQLAAGTLMLALIRMRKEIDEYESN